MLHDAADYLPAVLLSGCVQPALVISASHDVRDMSLSKGQKPV